VASLSILENVRRWIDGDTAELALEKAARDAQVKPRSKAEEFIVKIARAVESVMQDELVPLPQGTVIIPSEYVVFLSPDDDKEWQGAKRRGLVQGLYHVLGERAKEIAGKKRLETASFAIELRIDATLAAGDVRVQPGWDDPDGNKTGVLKRPAAAAAQPNAASTLVPAASVQQPQRPVIQQAVPIPAEDAEVMTEVTPRRAYLYRLEVWRGGVRQSVIPVSLPEIVVGRGSRSKPVDVPLNGDVEVSRRHLRILTDGKSSFWLVNEGKNPAQLSNLDLPTGQRVSVRSGMPINVCSYVLLIQPAG
jgi:hypothetical protein